MIKDSLKIKLNILLDYKRFFLSILFIFLSNIYLEVNAQIKLTPQLDSVSNYNQDNKSTKNSNNYSKSDYSSGDYNASNSSNDNSTDNNSSNPSNVSNPIKPLISPKDQLKITNLMKQGVQLTKQNNVKAAQNAFHKIILIDPTYTTAYYNLGVLAEQTNNLPDAAHYYSLVLKYDPNDSQTQQALDDVNQRLNASSNDNSTSDNSNITSSKGSNRNFSYDNSSSDGSSSSQYNTHSQGVQPSQLTNKNASKNTNFNRNLMYLGRGIGRMARSAMWYAMMFR